MIGTVIETNDVDPSLVFRQSLNAFNNSETMSYLKQNAENVYNSISSGVGMFNTTIKNIYGDIRNNIGAQKAKSILANTGSLIRDDMIQVRTINNIHESGMMNRQYIMSEPTIYELYKNNRIDGWDDMFVNNESEIDTTWRTDHLNSIDGVGVFKEDYMEVINTSMEYDNPLSVEDRFIICSLKETALAMMANGVDPTNNIKDSVL